MSISNRPLYGTMLKYMSWKQHL